MKHSIHVQGLVKDFGNFRALDGFDLTVGEGSVHGFLGPNGSGKSTTIRILLGLLKPTSGTINVLGKDPAQHPRALRQVGYVPGDVALWPNLTGAEIFRALESMRGIPVDRRKEDELIDAFQLDPSKRAREYSTGNRRKVSLIAALSIDAELLILDEPTAGLDPLMEAVFISQVRAASAEGTSILLSSHILSEVEKVCDNVTVIKSGRVVKSGDLSRLRHLSDHHLTARLTDSEAFLRSHPQATHDGQGVSVVVARDDIPATLQSLIDAGGEDITSTPSSLEEIFLRHYEADATHDGVQP